MRTLCKKYSLLTLNRNSFAMFRKNILTENRFDRNKRQGNQVLFDATQAAKIKEVREHFMGIRVNTAYLKCYNEDSFANCLEYRGRKMSELTFEASKSEKKGKQIPITSLTQDILKKINREELEVKLIELSRNYFLDLINKTRNALIEPNFDRESRRCAYSLMNSGYQFILKEAQAPPAIHIQSIQLIKGVEVTRNNNYTTDSYNVLFNEEFGFKQYKLWTVENKKLQEEELHNQRNMVLRVTALVFNPCSFGITAPNGQQMMNVSNCYHQFVYEMDLRHPPQFSTFKLTPYEYLQAYRPSSEGFIITNIDNKNQFYSFTYDEKHKKNILINKLV